ncbi:hypothetical protein ABZP36_011440 [Zizania latifolia]
MDKLYATISVLVLTLIHQLLLISADDFLSPGSYLSAERSSDVLYSPDGAFTCGFYNISPNASIFSVWFSNSTEMIPVWSANPLRPVYTRGSRVRLHRDGSMVLHDYNGQIVWTNNVSSSDAQEARLLGSGNLVVRGKGDFILWQSFASPTDTLLPNQNITGNLKLVSTSKSSVPGHYSFHFDDEHLLTLFDDEKDISFIYWPNPFINIWAKRRISFNSTTLGVLDSWGNFLGSDNASFVAADWGPGIMRSCKGFYYVEGNGDCYPKSSLLGGVTVQGLPGSTYLKLPEAFKVPESSIPRSQPSGPRYSPHCRPENQYFIANFSDASTSGQSQSQYLYFYGFLSAIFLVEGSRVSEWARTEDEDDELRMVLRRVVRMLAENVKLTQDSRQPWIADFIDSRLNGQFNYSQARTMAALAVSCVDEDRSKRPTMESAAQMLLSIDEESVIT